MLFRFLRLFSRGIRVSPRLFFRIFKIAPLLFCLILSVTESKRGFRLSMQLYCKPPGFTVMPQRKYLAGGLQSGCTATSTDAQYKMLPGIWSYYTMSKAALMAGWPFGHSVPGIWSYYTMSKATLMAGWPFGHSMPGIWSYYTIFFRFHSIGLCASFLKFSLF